MNLRAFLAIFQRTTYMYNHLLVIEPFARNIPSSFLINFMYIGPKSIFSGIRKNGGFWDEWRMFIRSFGSFSEAIRCCQSSSTSWAAASFSGPPLDVADSQSSPWLRQFLLSWQIRQSRLCHAVISFRQAAISHTVQLPLFWLHLWLASNLHYGRSSSFWLYHSLYFSFLNCFWNSFSKVHLFISLVLVSQKNPIFTSRFLYTSLSFSSLPFKNKPELPVALVLYSFCCLRIIVMQAA